MPILKFLTRFTEEADTNLLTKAQAFVLFPLFLEGNGEIQFRSNLYDSHAERISIWHESVQYLLITYSTPWELREAVSDVRDVRKLITETGLAFSFLLDQSK